MEPKNSLRQWFTSIYEGTCVQTNVSGSAPEYIMALKGYEFDQDWNKVCLADLTPNDARWRKLRHRSLFSRLLAKWPGIYWVGIPPRSVTEKEKYWQEWRHVESGAEREVWRRKEKTRFFYLKQFDYAFDCKKVETSQTIKIDLEFTVFVEGTNPHQALVKTDDWFARLESCIMKRMRDYVGMREFLELLSEHAEALESLKKNHALKDISADKGEKKPRKNFSDFISALSKERIAGDESTSDNGVDIQGGKTTQECFGVKITGANIESIEISAGQKEIETALLSRSIEAAKALAQLETNNAIKSAAEAEKSKIVTIGQGKAEALDLETGALTRRLEKVDGVILDKDGGSAVLIARENASAAKAQAEAVKDNKSITTVVFSSGGASPVVPVGK